MSERVLNWIYLDLLILTRYHVQCREISMFVRFNALEHHFDHIVINLDYQRQERIGLYEKWNFPRWAYVNGGSSILKITRIQFHYKNVLDHFKILRTILSVAYPLIADRIMYYYFKFKIKFFVRLKNDWKIDKWSVYKGLKTNFSYTYYEMIYFMKTALHSRLLPKNVYLYRIPQIIFVFISNSKWFKSF